MASIVITEPGSHKEPIGESTLWMAWYAERPKRVPVFTAERTAANRSRFHWERNPFVTFLNTVLTRMACSLE